MCACFDPAVPDEYGKGSLGPCSINSNAMAVTSSCWASLRSRHHCANSSVCSTFQLIGLYIPLMECLASPNPQAAGGSVGVGRVARAATDCYSLVVGIQNTHVLNGVVYTLQYDPVKDFEPI